MQNKNPETHIQGVPEPFETFQKPSRLPLQRTEKCVYCVSRCARVVYVACLYESMFVRVRAQSGNCKVHARMDACVKTYSTFIFLCCFLLNKVFTP